MSKQTVIAFAIFIVLLLLSVGSTYFYLTRPKIGSTDSANSLLPTFTPAPDSGTTTTDVNTQKANDTSARHIVINSQNPLTLTDKTGTYQSVWIKNSSIKVSGNLQINLMLSASFSDKGATSTTGVMFDNKLGSDDPNVRMIRFSYAKDLGKWALRFKHGSQSDFHTVMVGSPENAIFSLKIPKDGKSVQVTLPNGSQKSFQFPTSLYDSGNDMRTRAEVLPYSTLKITTLVYNSY